MVPKTTQVFILTCCCWWCSVQCPKFLPLEWRHHTSPWRWTWRTPRQPWIEGPQLSRVGWARQKHAKQTPINICKMIWLHFIGTSTKVLTFSTSAIFLNSLATASGIRLRVQRSLRLLPPLKVNLTSWQVPKVPWTGVPLRRNQASFEYQRDVKESVPGSLTIRVASIIDPITDQLHSAINRGRHWWEAKDS